jgi:L-cysteine S-thiosulfotransferase
MLLLAALASACASSPRMDAMDALAPAGGDAARGREIFLARDGGHCVLCHQVPDAKLAGDVGPSLAGVGSRLTPGQIRLRIADITRVNPQSVMPTFHRSEGLKRVAPQYAGKPALGAQQVEDLVAYLGTLR